MLSFLYGPSLTSIPDAGKAIALTIWTFVGKVMSLFFNMLSGFVIVFFFFFKEQSSFNFMTVVTICSDLRAQENKVCSDIVSIVSPSVCHEVMGRDAMFFIFVNVEL